MLAFNGYINVPRAKPPPTIEMYAAADRFTEVLLDNRNSTEVNGQQLCLHGADINVRDEFAPFTTVIH